MSGEPTYRVVVPAAGAGRRMASDIPKQYLPLAGKTVIEHTLDALFACSRITSIVVAVSADDDMWPAIAERYGQHPLESVTGGDERCHSVLNALEHLSHTGQDDNWVLVHDAARPCVRSADIDQLIETALALLEMISDIGREVGPDAVLAHHDAIFFIAEVHCPEPRRAVFLIQHAAFLHSRRRQRRHSAIPSLCMECFFAFTAISARS